MNSIPALSHPTRPARSVASTDRTFLLLLLALSGAMLLPLRPRASAAPEIAAMPPHEAIIRDYFAAWERKDWEAVAVQLAPDFTFTSPAPDDHLSIAQFKAKCWNQADHIARFEFPRIVGDTHEAMAIVHVVTNDGRVIRNVEYFTFRDGRIHSIEVFFGGSGHGFPTAM